MRAVILAGGEGKALKPLTCTTPFSAVELFGKPFISYSLEKLKTSDMSSIYIILGYKASEIVALFPKSELEGIKAELITEEASYNTAGALKSCLPGFDGATIVIYGNVFFDFNIEALCDFHLRENNEVTVVEGLEGVYIFESAAFEYIPENFVFDIESDLLPILYKKGLKIGSFKNNSYSKIIKNTRDFSELNFDILSKKSTIVLPELADGFFCAGGVPTGEYVAVPPVWIGKNVQIEEGAVVGPFSVVGSGSLISKGAKVRESVLFDNIYVSSKCNINGALLCEGVSVKHGAKIFEGAVIGSESIIGEGVTVNADIRIWPKKTVEDGECVNEDIKYATLKTKALRINSIIAGDFGVELTPEKAAKLGAALGTLFENVRVGIGIDGEANALALKCGFLGGLISTGAKSFDFGKCFNSQIFYYSVFCDLDFAVFISGGSSGVSFSFYEKGGIPLVFEHIKKLEEIMQAGGFNRCSGGDCRSVTVMNSMEKMYEAEILRMFPNSMLSLGTSVFSGNDTVTACVNNCLNKLSADTGGDELIFKINKLGTKLTAIEGNNTFSHEKLLAIASYNEMLSGNDIALPWDAPQIITSLGALAGRRVYRYSEETHASEISAISVGAKQLWSRDAVFLLFKLLFYMNEKRSTLYELSEDLPEFYIAKKVMEINIPPQKLAKRLLDSGFQKVEGSGVILKKKTDNIKLKSDFDGKTLKIIAEAVSVEAANELCDEVFNLISNGAIDKEA